jgi:hypothetical protein
MGAYVLAAQIAAGPDPAVAFPTYESALYGAVRASRDVGPAVIRTLIPRSRTQVAATTQVLRLLAGLPAPFQRRLTSCGGGPAAMLDGVLLPAPAG